LSPAEKEDRAVEDLARPSPKKKPPREDLRKRRVRDEEDPDLKSEDPDLSLNYKRVAYQFRAAAVARRYQAERVARRVLLAIEESEHAPGETWKTEAGNWRAKNRAGDSKTFDEEDAAQAWAKGESEGSSEDDSTEDEKSKEEKKPERVDRPVEITHQRVTQRLQQLSTGAGELHPTQAKDLSSILDMVTRDEEESFRRAFLEEQTAAVEEFVESAGSAYSKGRFADVVERLNQMTSLVESEDGEEKSSKTFDEEKSLKNIERLKKQREDLRKTLPKDRERLQRMGEKVSALDEQLQLAEKSLREGNDDLQKLRDFLVGGGDSADDEAALSPEDRRNVEERARQTEVEFQKLKEKRDDLADQKKDLELEAKEIKETLRDREKELRKSADELATASARHYVAVAVLSTVANVDSDAPEAKVDAIKASSRTWRRQSEQRYQALPAKYQAQRLEQSENSLEEVRDQLKALTSNDSAGSYRGSGADRDALLAQASYYQADLDAGRLHQMLTTKPDADAKSSFTGNLVRYLHAKQGVTDSLYELSRQEGSKTWRAAAHTAMASLSDEEFLEAIKDSLPARSERLAEVLRKGTYTQGDEEHPLEEEMVRELRASLLNAVLNDRGAEADSDSEEALAARKKTPRSKSPSKKNRAPNENSSVLDGLSGTYQPGEIPLEEIVQIQTRARS
jgi:hypothetical protein